MGRISGFNRPSVRAATSPLALYMDAALILQNKGGGHGEIGFHLAKQLSAKGLDVHMLQAADAKMDKPPFKDYGDLSDMGVTIDKVDLADAEALKSALAGKSFTHVFDNFAKDVATVSTVAGMAKDWKVKNYAYVSSAGLPLAVACLVPYLHLCCAHVSVPLCESPSLIRITVPAWWGQHTMCGCACACACVCARMGVVCLSCLCVCETHHNLLHVRRKISQQACTRRRCRSQ